MMPQQIVNFCIGQQELLWFTTLFVDLGFTVILYRLFGKAGLQVAIATSIILANLQGPKLTEIFGIQTSLGVIFYSSIKYVFKLVIAAIDTVFIYWARAAHRQRVAAGATTGLFVGQDTSVSL